MDLLPLDTVLRGQKVQPQTRGVFSGITGELRGLNGLEYEGYEIHMGRSEEKLPPVVCAGNVYGSYIHGVFDAPGICDGILRALCGKKGIDFSALGTFDVTEYKERQYDLLADTVRQNMDMELVYRVLNREV